MDLLKDCMSLTAKERKLLAYKLGFQVTGDGGEHVLAAYFEPKAGQEISLDDLKEYLRQKLPGYMVPAHFLAMNRMPLNAAGKIDRKALPEPVAKLGTETEAPRDERERTLARIWSTLLEMDEENIGIDDNFFEIGGHSLKVTRLAALIHKELEVKIPLSELFELPTIRDIARYMDSQEESGYETIAPAEPQETYPLSNAQRRLWIICQFEEDSIAYNQVGALTLDGGFDPDVFQAAVQALSDRHESLRTVFLTIDGQPRQKILERLDVAIERIDLRNLTEEERQRETSRVLGETANKPFNMEAGPLFVFKLLRLEGTVYFLIANFHHIVNDGWSIGVIRRELFTLYNHFLRGGGYDAIPLEAVELQYKDYSQWHNQRMAEGYFDRYGGYWREKLSDKPTGIELPLDFPRPPVQTFNGGRVFFTIDPEETRELGALCPEADATMFMKAMTLLSLFLQRISGQRDILLGSPIAGRKQPELHQMIGFLVNTLVYRVDADPDASFAGILKHVRQETLGCYENQDYPFDTLVEDLGLARDLSRSPLFNVMLAFNNEDMQDFTLAMEGVTATPHLQLEDFNPSVFDLVFFWDESDGGVDCEIMYNCDLFRRDTVERMAANMKTLLRSVVQQPDVPVSRLELLDTAERRLLIQEFNDTIRHYPQLTVTQLAERGMRDGGDRTAVVTPAGEHITHLELNKRANQLSHYLTTHYSLGPGSVTGIAIDRSIEMVVAILAVVKSGGGYISIDPNYPEDRLRHMLLDSRTSLVLTHHVDLPVRDDEDLTVERLALEAVAADLEGQDTKNPPRRSDMEDIVYVIYTSGSTGTPNGAMLSHRILSNLIQWQGAETAIAHSGRTLQFTSINFCVSFQEIMTSLSGGGQLHLIGDVERQDVEYLLDFLVSHRIENLYLPFSYLNFLFNLLADSQRLETTPKTYLKHIITAGEQLKITAGLRQFLARHPHIQLHNHYGSSEMHVVTSYTLDAAAADQTPVPPAGKPVANTRIYILDEAGNPVPIGVWGEIHVDGAGEIAGYIHNQELTDKKLLDHPEFSAITGNRLYRSGDVGRFLPDGNIEMKGRKDSQVKIRGFRVELSEVESKIVALDGVKDCVVVVKGGGNSEKFLAAYVVLEHISVEEIKGHIRDYLPQYMIPRFTVLERLPLMPNGKVDRDRLPEPADESLQGPDADRMRLGRLLQGMEAEANPLEQALARLLRPLTGKIFDPTAGFGSVTVEVEDNGGFAGDIDAVSAVRGLSEASPQDAAIRVVDEQGAVRRAATYSQLDQWSGRLASYLNGDHMVSQSPVGLLTKDPIRMAVSALAVKACGGEPVHTDENLLETNGCKLLLTTAGDVGELDYTSIMGLNDHRIEPLVTAPRTQITDLAELPLPDRSLVDYEKYGGRIGLAMVKHTVTIQATRGCPYQCLYCHKIWPKRHVIRPAKHIYEEVETYYRMGMRRFVFVDDIFNLDEQNSREFFQMIIDNGLDVHFFFPNGLRSDLLTEDYIDLMVKAGTVGLGMALETASPRLQKLIKKNLNLDALYKNVDYICRKHPHVIIELFTMHGFPTETEEEAGMTLDFLKRLHWVDFPYLHILKIFPNTDMAVMAMENGVSAEAIERSAHFAYHELPETLPFDKSFTLSYQADFVNNYFLKKERLLAKLPYQLKVLTVDELVQKYNSYLPVAIKTVKDLLDFAGVTPQEAGLELGADGNPVDAPLGLAPEAGVPGISQKMKEHFQPSKPEPGALRVLLLDLSQFFSSHKDILYDGVEPPLGLMYLMTYLNREFGGKVNGKIAKSRFDFDDYAELKQLLEEFDPQVVGIRTLSYFSGFFHQAVAMIRQWGFDVPIVAGGPYATSDFRSVLQDPNVDLVVLSEGEVTFAQLIGRVLDNEGRLPEEAELKGIAGLAFVPAEGRRVLRERRRIVMVDAVDGVDLVDTVELGDGDSPATTGGSALALSGEPAPVLRALAEGMPLWGLDSHHIPGGISWLEFGDSSGDRSLRVVLEPEHSFGRVKAFENVTEEKLAGIWAGLLGIEAAGIDRNANFFELGGHSLKATTMMSLIHKEFGVRVKLIEIFKTPFISEIAQLIHEAEAGEYMPLQPVEKREFEPLSPVQRQLYAVQQTDPESTAYHMPAALELEGTLDVERLQETLELLIRRHETLRTSFHMRDGVPVQKIHEDVAIDVPVIEDDGEAFMRRFIRPFDLERAPLMRVALVKQSSNRWHFLLDMHHIITDGVSNGIFIRDFIAAYTGTELAPLAIGYRDYCRFLEEQNNRWTEQLAQWARELEEPPLPLALPLDFPRLARQSFNGGVVRFDLDRDSTRQLAHVARQQDATLFMVLLACYHLLLSRLSGQEDIVVGTPVAGRKHPDLAAVMGMFVNTLPLRLRGDGSQTFRDFLAYVKERALAAFERQEVPLADIVEATVKNRDLSRSPLFDVMMVLENVDAPEIRLPDLRVRPLEHLFEDIGSKFDLTLVAEEGDEVLTFAFEYNSDLLLPATVRRFGEMLLRIIDQVCASPDVILSEVSLVSPQERETILKQFNKTAPVETSGATIHELILRQAETSPEAVAVEGINGSLTYRQLSGHGRRVAARLRQRGVNSGDVVAVALADPLQLSAGLLGIMMTGAAYLPVDPSLPKHRRDYMIDDSRCSFVLTDASLTGQFQADVVLAIEEALDAADDPAMEPVPYSPELPAYVIFTSGTTGLPKGVMITHKSAVNSLEFRRREYGMDEHWCCLQLFSPSFDGFVTGFFTPLIAGARVVFPPQEMVKDIPKLQTIIKSAGIHHFIAVPSLLQALLEGLNPADATSLKVVTLAGERVPTALVDKARQLLPHLEVAVEYGVTEAAVLSTCRCRLEPGAEPDIGYPIQNTVALVLDPQRQLLPIGLAGELYIGGVGVARGYLNRPALTEERFVTLSWAGDEGLPTLFYRSGDRARFVPGGALQFLGRIDQQLKIRGFRIEPGEIEEQLKSHPEVRDAVCVPREDANGDLYLAAFVVADHEGEHDPSVYRDYLSGRLPDYMIPAVFRQLERLPLNPSGKVDRQQLPQGDDVAIGAIVPPATADEEQLVGIWAAVLGIPPEQIGVTSEFFQLGGHSLNATRLAQQIHKHFQVEMPLATLFGKPTIRQQAAEIARLGQHTLASIPAAADMEFYPQSSAQRRLFFLDQFENSAAGYHMPAILQLREQPDIQRITTVFQQLIQRHEPLRTSFHLQGESPVQKIHQQVPFEVEILDGKLATEVLAQDFIRPFDLAAAPLLRVGVAERPAGQSLLLLDMHHIIADGSSVGLLINDFVQLYNGVELTPLDIQYKDFAVWQTELAVDGTLQDKERYWLEVFNDAPAVPRLNLPLDYPRPKVQTFEGDTFEFVIDQELLRDLKKIERDHGTTLFMNLLAALNILLFRYSLQEDIIIGSGVAGRTHADLEPVIGMFVNMLAMRNTISAHMTVSDFLKTVKGNSLKAFENQAVQFEDLVERLDLERSASRNPLFDVAMVVQNFALDEGLLKRGGFTPQPIPTQTAKFDLTLYAQEIEDRVEMGFEYCSALFKPETVARLAKHLTAIMRRMVEAPDCLVGQIDILDEEERAYVLEELNRTDTEFETDVTVLDLFARQVAERPEQEALVGPCLLESREFSWTYERLHREAARISGYLRRNGVRPEEPVAVLMEPSLQRIAAVLGVLLAGGAFVPMPMTLPEARLRDMIQDAHIRVVISQKLALKQLNRLQWECPSFNRFLCVDSREILQDIEAQHNELMDQSLWHHVGETAEDDITGGGWMNSFTGAPLSRLEMDEYGDNVLRKVEEIIAGFDRKIRVLEIGCASGITMFRVAPLVELYVGTDLSEVIIEKNRARVEAERIENIKLFTLAAHEVDRVDSVDPVDASGFDLVIINSVIQCFHGHNYLKQVVRKAVDLVGDKGFIFVGDVMDLGKKALLEADTLAFKEKHLEDQFQTKTDWSVELFVARAFWDDLIVDIDGLSHCRCTEKIHTIENELTNYRYDALLVVDKIGQSTANTAKLNYQDDLRALEENDTAVFDAEPHHLAYIIYTSGTTGKPRGVMLEHEGLLNLCRWHHEFYDIGPSDRATLYAGFGFDASVWELFPYLTAGAGLYIVPDEARLDMEKLAAFYSRHLITVSFLPTPIFQQFMDQDAPSLRLVLTGGDRLHLFKPQSYKLFNNYGPTEYTVVTTAGEITDAVDPLPIGKPIANTKVFILHPGTSLPQPAGLPGELCIAGPGIARGYLNHPHSNETSFVEINLPGADKTVRVYRSGDLARWLPDGTIEFLGRIDQQVKIRGYRIELADIEEHLLAYPGVRDAVVVDRREEGGGKSLCGYVTGIDGVEEQTVKDYLLRRLPDYMVPAYILNLDELPLTPNGKVDRRALPIPGIELSEDVVPPEGDVEILLAEIWSGVLGIPQNRIGATDNFFQRGGDSIKTIQVSSRLQQHGFSLEVKDFFLNPTIRELAAVVKRDQVVIDQGIVEGEVLMTPIQRWFFDSDIADRHHFNQAVMLDLKKDFTKERIVDAFERLIAHHDVLRLKVDESDGGIVQRNRGLDDGPLVTLTEQDLRGAGDMAAAVEDAASDVQKNIDLAHGPLVKLGWFHTETGDHLLVAIHHLVVDGVSWRILLEDLATILGADSLEMGAVVLPLKTHSFQYWAQQLYEYSRGESLLSELDYWKQQETIVIEPLPTNGMVEDKDNIVSQSRAAEFKLDRQTTGWLQKDAHQAFNTEINDILLAGLALALHRWAGMTNMAVLLEGHGREAIMPGVNINRTVGWFTSQFPVLLTAAEDGNLARLIKETKETLHRVPSRGVGYGILRYVTPRELTGDLAFNIEPDIAFNYLGEMDAGVQLDGVEPETLPFGLSRYTPGKSQSPNQQLRQLLSINSAVQSGILRLAIDYHPDCITPERAELLAEIYKTSLVDIINFCIHRREQEYTPSDFSDSSIDDQGLDSIVDELGDEFDD